MEAALLEMAEGAAGGSATAKVDEIPFDADRRRMSTVHETTHGPLLYCKGAPEAVIPLCIAVQAANATVPLDDALRARLESVMDEMAERGLRILALAWRELPSGTPRENWEERLVLAAGRTEAPAKSPRHLGEQLTEAQMQRADARRSCSQGA